MKSSIKDFCSKRDQIRSFFEKVFVWYKSDALATELFGSIKGKIIKMTCHLMSESVEAGEGIWRKAESKEQLKQKDTFFLFLKVFSSP